MTSQDRQHEEWIARPERGFVPLINLFVWLVLHIGRSAARLTLYPICVYFLLFSRGSRAASRNYLAKVLGRPPTLGDLFRHFHTFAACVLDRIFLLSGRFDLFDLRLHDDSIVTDILAHGGSCLLIGSHVGSFEVLRVLARKHLNMRTSTVMYKSNARKTNAILNALNPDFEPDVIEPGLPESMIKVAESLSRGQCVGILADRSISAERRSRCVFLGAPADFPVGPFRVAALVGRPAVLMFGLYRGGNRYDVYFELLSDGTADSESMLRRYVERLEHYCRQAPFNWFNFFDFWK